MWDTMRFIYDCLGRLDEVNAVSTVIRLLLAVVIGGVIGMERGARSQPAGFRTHMLVCVGACLAMLTNEFVYENMSRMSDPTRLGAQVITGVGFLGVGTILVTGRHRIRGLTTAAGLWASACTGLAIGIGFYYGAITAAVLIFTALAFFPAIENRILIRSRTLEIYVEMDGLKSIRSLLDYLRGREVEVLDTHFNSSAFVSGSVGLHLSLKIQKNTRAQLLKSIEKQDGVLLIEEL
ncbi:MAG: MgtC/SapB family protein [Clostridiales Family XIII bacterium]|jgi:putative Mg2+ transporter-C (MgtC) family protein|nr:MgtC/SapB family protein [Clostridiales Family XIII bacterium]